MLAITGIKKRLKDQEWKKIDYLLKIPGQGGCLRGIWGLNVCLGGRNSHRSKSANRGLPLPRGRGVCETQSKKGRSRYGKRLRRVYSPQRGIETMV